MAVDFFLIDAPGIIPSEWSAWQIARADWRACCERLFALEEWCGPEFERLNAIACDAADAADELEEAARRAFWVKLSESGAPA